MCENGGSSGGTEDVASKHERPYGTVGGIALERMLKKLLNGKSVRSMHGSSLSIWVGNNNK